jgi:hypothetical protein
MNYKMSELKGIDGKHVGQLRDAGIENTDEMMEVWNNQAKRATALTAAGLTEEQFGRLVSMARMARMKGIGPKYAHLLVSAGVKGSKSLATFTPQGLVTHLGEVSVAKSLAGPVPSLLEVGAWFAEMRSPSSSDSARTSKAR